MQSLETKAPQPKADKYSLHSISPVELLSVVLSLDNGANYPENSHVVTVVSY